MNGWWETDSVLQIEDGGDKADDGDQAVFQSQESMQKWINIRRQLRYCGLCAGHKALRKTQSALGRHPCSGLTLAPSKLCFRMFARCGLLAAAYARKTNNFGRAPACTSFGNQCCRCRIPLVHLDA